MSDETEHRAAPPRPPLGLALRAALAAVVSVAVAQCLHLPYPLYALISAVIATDASFAQTHRLGLQRLIGTALGAVFGAALSLVVPYNLWAIGFAIVCMFLLCHALGLHGAAKLAAYVSGIVILEHGNGPVAYAAYRFVETGIGIAVAYVAALLWEFLPRVVHRRYRLR